MIINELDLKSNTEARGLIYKLISLGFRYPTEELVTAVSDSQYWKQLDSLVFQLYENNGSLMRLASTDAAALQQEASNLGTEGFEVEYTRLFQLAKEMECPLTASEYMEGETRQAIAVAQLNGIYKAFGVKMNISDSPDNISVMLEFMSWLCAKELNAQVKDSPENLESCRKAQAILLEDYLGWIPLMVQSLKINAEVNYYLWLGDFLVEFLRLERSCLLNQSA